MTEDEVVELSQDELFEELEHHFGDDALNPVGSYYMEFEVHIGRRDLKRIYIKHLQSLLELPETLDTWQEEHVWALMYADLVTRAQAALLALDSVS